MNPPRFAEAVLLGATLLLAMAGAAPAQEGAPAGPMRATITKEMGDLGGKYYGKVPDPAKTKHYYIAAEPTQWDFAPSGQDLVCGKAFSQEFESRRTAMKMRYVQYADPGFTQRVLPQARLGILGPVLRGITGQYLEITFLNRCKQPLSMHPHGVRYDKDSEGAYYQPSPGLGAAVAPGAKFTYVWYCDESSAPLPTEPSSRAWLYHSHAGPDGEINLGLLGFIVVTDSARARADGTPNDIDREMGTAFMIFDETNNGAGGGGDPDRVAVAAPPSAQPVDPNAGQRYTINGLAYGNLNGLDLNEGERVRWYLFGLGSESDLHTPHWHGLRVIEGGRHTDVVELLPASMKVADMVADNPGTWIFHCHVAEHMANGMFTAIHVHPASGPPVSREPEVAFFGMPQALQTLRFQTADLLLGNKDGANAGEIDLAGTVTVPELCLLTRTPFTVKIGDKTQVMQPDETGLCTTPDGVLLVKSTIQVGAVRGGKLEFDLTLRGNGWIEELRRQGIIKENNLVAGHPMQVDLQVGDVQHSVTAPLKLATQ